MGVALAAVIADEPQTPAARQAAMRAVNPAFIPRNHRVEAVIQAATNNDDYAPFEQLIAVLAKPYAGSTNGPRCPGLAKPCWGITTLSGSLAA